MCKKLLILLACATLIRPALRAQVAPAAIGGDRRLWVGGEYSNFKPDWALTRLPGIGIYADLTIRKRFGLEGEARFLNFTKPQGVTEKSYLGGGYATLYRRGKLAVNAKFLLGGGFVNFGPTFGYGSYLEYAPGANVEYRFARKLKARFDYEYQLIPSAPGAIVPQGSSHGMSPTGFSGGVSYRVF